MRMLTISESSVVSTVPKKPDGNMASNIERFFDTYHSLLKRTFYKFGFFVARYPSYFIIIPLFISVLGLTGFQRMVFENNSDVLFIPSDGKAKMTRQYIEEVFPSNTSDLFDPSRVTEASCFAKIYISAKDGGTVFRRSIWKDVVLLDALIQNITVEWDGKTLRYEDICAKWKDECFRNIIYNLNDLVPDVEDGKASISYPVMLYPFVLPMFFGGASVNETEGVMTAARALFTTYWLSRDDEQQRQRAHIWERKLLSLLESHDFDTIIVDRYTSRSIPDEMIKNSERLLPFLPFAMVLLLGFSIICVSSRDCVRSNIILAVFAVLTIILAVCSAFGLLMYIGVPFISINAAALFLILGIGLDDMFVLLSAWNRTRIQDGVESRLATSYGACSVSLCVTSATNAIAFFIGALTTIQGVRIFCIYLGVCVMFTWLWFVTMFGALLALAGRLEENQRHSLCCFTVKALSQAEKRSWLYRLFCTGGINRSDPWNASDNRNSCVPVVLQRRLAPALGKKLVQGFVLLCYLVYLAVAIYGCINVQTGLDPKSLAVDESYLQRFFDMENQNFRKFPYRIQVIIKGNLSYNDVDIKRDIMQLHRDIEKTPYVGPRLYTRSWIRGFLSFLWRNTEMKGRIVDEASFISTLKEDFLSPFSKESVDIVLANNDTRIVSSRFIVQGYDVKDISEDQEMMRAFSNISENSNFDVSFYHPTFVLYDQYLAVKSFTLKMVALASLVMTVVFFIFVPSPGPAIWVGLSMLSIQVGVIGFMSLWGVRLDSISLINLIMVVGYSVDFSGHFVYTFFSSKVTTTEERLKESFYNIGLPILQSGISTILGVILFIFVPSTIYRTFFKIIFLVSLFGILHSLLILPVLMSISYQMFSRAAISAETNNDQRETKSSFKRNSNSGVLDEQNGEIVTGLRFVTPSVSRESSVSGSNSVQSESLGSSSGSSELISEPDKPYKKNSQEIIEIEHL